MRPPPRLALVVGLCCACSGLATKFAGRPGPEEGLLRGKAPARSHGVTHVDRLTDGIAAEPYDPPRTELATVMGSSDAFVSWDLGAASRLTCAVVIADGDDRYTLWASMDGDGFTPVWNAEPTGGRGMQPRIARDLAGVGRWLRLTASGGDGLYTVSELAVADLCPPRWPPALALQKGTPVDRTVTLKAWGFAVLSVVFILGWRRRAPDWIKLLGAIPAGLGVALAVDVADLWPLPGSLLATLAAALLVVAGAAVARLAWQRKRRLG